MSEDLVRMEHIDKFYGRVQALDDVNFNVTRQEIVGLLGDNGAGKSTLIKTVSGIWEPSDGEVLWQGKRVNFRTPKDATDIGIATVYQDLALCDNLDIVQNMLLGHELRKHGLLDEIEMEKTARRTLQDMRVTTVRNIRQPVGSLSGGQRQAIAVAKAVMLKAKLVIMDEPTAALGVSQTALVLEIIQNLASQGIAVLVISHNLPDVFKVADRLAVLFLGQLVSSGPISDYDTSSAVHWMTTGTAPANGANGATGPATGHGGLTDG
jgi:ABC-type sugar transport system ATPase subunit